MPVIMTIVKTKIIKIIIVFIIAAIILCIYPSVKSALLDGTEIINEYYMDENGEMVAM